MSGIAGRHEKAVKEMQQKHAEKVLAEKEKRASVQKLANKGLIKTKSTGERWSEVVYESQSTEQKKFKERRRMTLIDGYRTTIDTGLVTERKRVYEELILQLSSSALAVRNTVAAGLKQIKQEENNKERTSSTHSSHNSHNNIHNKEVADSSLEEFVLGTTKIYGLDFITEDGLRYLSEYKSRNDNNIDDNDDIDNNNIDHDIMNSNDNSNTSINIINLRDSTSSPTSVNSNSINYNNEQHVPLYAGLYGTTDNHALSITAAGLKSNDDFFVAITIAATNDTSDKDLQSVLGRQRLAVVGLKQSKSDASTNENEKKEGKEERVVILDMELNLATVEGQVMMASQSTSSSSSSSQPTSPETMNVNTSTNSTTLLDSIVAEATDDSINVDANVDANVQDTSDHAVIDDTNVNNRADNDDKDNNNKDNEDHDDDDNDDDVKTKGGTSNIDVVDVVDDIIDSVVDNIDEKEKEEDKNDEDCIEISNADTSIAMQSDDEPNISLHTVATADVTIDADNTFSSPLLSRLSLGSPQPLSEPRGMRKEKDNNDGLVVDTSDSEVNSNADTPINTYVDSDQRSISLSNPGRASNLGNRIIISGWVSLLSSRPSSPFSSSGVKRFLVLWNTLLLVFIHRPEHEALQNSDATVLVETAEEAFTLGPGCIAKRKWTMFSRKTMISIESLRPGLLNSDDVNGNDIYNTNANTNAANTSTTNATFTDSSVNTSTSSLNTSEETDDNKDNTDLSVSVDDATSTASTSSSPSNSSPNKNSPSLSKSKASSNKGKRSKTSMLFTCSADEESFWLEGLDQVCYAQRLGTLN